jgi:hypothetical protein
MTDLLYKGLKHMSTENSNSGSGNESNEGRPLQPWMDPNWEPSKEDIAALTNSELAFDDGDHAATARRLFKENAPTAALSIIRMATHGSTERIKLDASKYVLERVLGKVGDDGEDVITPIDEVLKGLVHDVEEHANGGNTSN